ncbi:formylmethanofuran dehydrogenase subunit B [Fimbriiglobus ruber]|uniref:Formylmethanofuran dehydrogenase subunit B n=1 Tax=Fimbriiglobus ruber TaxID=1908690 RepID=A0A225DPI0_9BACT|nr:formylmethanofuran dehydrogenase subunit B [Fimbriiglobus ruber]OWK43380.1 Formylmethanofuran dehydrogenase subunit B [Fimbriiglobus ruber]
MTQTITEVACTVCGCVCDDLTVTVEGGRVIRAAGACKLAEPWFLAHNTATPPAAKVAGQPAAFADAVARAADLLRHARAPLIYGLSRSTTEGQRAAVALADRIGATIDTTASTGHAPSIVALQQVGESTCTLGEVKARADLVVFWGTDPVETHPRHFERYSVDPVGLFLPEGRKDRFVVVVDDHETKSARHADLFISVPHNRDWEALWGLRLLVKGKKWAGILNPPTPDSEKGGGDKPDAGAHSLPQAEEKLRDLAARMKACKFGIVFFGAGLTRRPLAHRTIEALLQLVTDLNAHTRFYARRMRRYGDVAGADSVLAWQTGYPFGVNLARGYPRYNPGEFTGPDLLARKEVDACVIVGSDTVADFPPSALAHLRTIPVVLLDSPGNQSPVAADVKFTTAVYGIHRPGTAYRMDEVPIPLRVLLPTDYPSDGEVLEEMLKRVKPAGTEDIPG